MDQVWLRPLGARFRAAQPFDASGRELVRQGLGLAVMSRITERSGTSARSVNLAGYRRGWARTRDWLAGHGFDEVVQASCVLRCMQQISDRCSIIARASAVIEVTNIPGWV